LLAVRLLEELRPGYSCGFCSTEIITESHMQKQKTSLISFD